jgi:surfeit locus 1 family protein
MLIRNMLGPGVAILLALVGVGLGVWQLGRADEKKAMTALRSERAQILNLGSDYLWRSGQDAQSLDQQRVRVSGQWRFDQTLFLDNRAWEGQAGAHVLTPLMLSDQSMVWVNRGWIPKPPGVSVVPEIPKAPPAAALEGVALASVMKRMELSRDPAALRRDAVWQNFDWDAARDRLPGNVWPVIVWQTTDNNDGLRRRVPEVSSDVPKHLGYAAQWFLMSAVALFFAWRLWKK